MPSATLFIAADAEGVSGAAPRIAPYSTPRTAPFTSTGNAVTVRSRSAETAAS